MKKVSLTLLILILCIPQAFTSPKYIATKDKIRARVDSTVSSDFLGYLLKNDEVEVLEQRYGWYKIKLPQRFGCYIAKKLTKKVNKHEIEVIASNVNLRTGPSLESYIIGKAPRGSRFPRIKETGQWVKIQGYPCIEGWVHKKFLRQLENEIDLALFVKQIMPKLSQPDIQKKHTAHKALIEKGEKIIPLLETYIDQASKNACYSIISVLTHLCKNNTALIPYFLEKIDSSSVKTSSMYLDVAQEVIQPKVPKNAYFYIAQSGQLTPENIQEAKRYLVEKYRSQEKK